ncbi:hypothetical protein PTTG_28256 [Puccinia triticina 1-1 BBBD Race 1]|uniref:Uncharacterized protein n=2 Tax=Puccinia triticina TaxID=208348 RepID=A0A180GDC5_PUCT1|nr:uncharacterized protein PtA15_8A300 [Puccinia triticina]OAV90564.1 hypothetical protein PTTG_28256 [Puccinia triticina 1-1 BBBD Race 1]WAQ87396.1 hypothetical protein PtA15_8A300 [Puccinia triticina]WAR57248.1 hypothetical protein PtB15_8B295 [Puccinia triticina]
MKITTSTNLILFGAISSLANATPGIPLIVAKEFMEDSHPVLDGSSPIGMYRLIHLAIEDTAYFRLLMKGINAALQFAVYFPKTITPEIIGDVGSTSKILEEDVPSCAKTARDSIQFTRDIASHAATAA